MGRFIKSKVDKTAYNRNFISYIRMLAGKDGLYAIAIGYAPCNDAYKEIVLAEGMDINRAEDELDKYLADLEEEPLQEYFGDFVSSERGW